MENLQSLRFSNILFRYFNKGSLPIYNFGISGGFPDTNIKYFIDFSNKLFDTHDYFLLLDELKSNSILPAIIGPSDDNDILFTLYLKDL